MLRYRINWSGPAAGWSVFHFDGELSTAGLAQSNADALETWLNAIDAQISNQQSMRVDAEVLEVDIGTGQTVGVETVTTTAVIGTQPGQMVPQAAQILTRWRTGSFIAGREIRGRTFVPGASAGAMATNGEVIAAALLTFDTAAATLLSSTEFGIYSPTNSLFATASDGSTWGEWAVQRGRRE